MQDEEYTAIREYLMRGQMPTNLPSTASNFRATCAKYECKAGKLWRDDKLVLKESQLEDVWQQCHQHRGIM